MDHENRRKKQKDDHGKRKVKGGQQSRSQL